MEGAKANPLGAWSAWVGEALDFQFEYGEEPEVAEVVEPEYTLGGQETSVEVESAVA